MLYGQELTASGVLLIYRDEMNRLLMELGASAKAMAIHHNAYYKRVYEQAKALVDKMGEFVSREEIENVRATIYDADNVISNYVAQQAFTAAFGTYFGARPLGTDSGAPFESNFGAAQHTGEYQQLKEKRDLAVEKFCSTYPRAAGQFRCYCEVLAELADLDRVYDFCASYELGIAMLKQYRPDFERDKVFEAALDKAIKAYLYRRPAPSSLG